MEEILKTKQKVDIEDREWSNEKAARFHVSHTTIKFYCPKKIVDNQR